MPGGVEMLGGVTVLRVVAASDVTARQAQPEMHPGVAHLQALLAPFARRGHVVYLILMRAGRHTASGNVSRRFFDNRYAGRPIEIPGSRGPSVRASRPPRMYFAESPARRPAGLPRIARRRASV